MQYAPGHKTKVKINQEKCSNNWKVHWELLRFKPQHYANNINWRPVLQHATEITTTITTSNKVIKSLFMYFSTISTTLKCIIKRNTSKYQQSFKSIIVYSTIMGKFMIFNLPKN